MAEYDWGTAEGRLTSNYKIYLLYCLNVYKYVYKDLLYISNIKNVKTLTFLYVFDNIYVSDNI